ncbi:MAG: integral peroxisomal membrane peroxin-domain-containing protein [Benjaminiella poitrasii]|nr:MAG: integral peroxisomal membrane peroxin-domain-containing protein [Benjaminiella poitrasii]
MSHLFEDKTFTHFTYCDNCKQLLWGLKEQGVKCKECSYTCHRKCQSSAPACSSSISNGFLGDTSHPDSRAENYLHSSSTLSATITTKKPKQHVKPAKENNYSSIFDHIKAIAMSDKLHTLLAEAALTKQIPVNSYLANQAALNPQITAKYFTRFVSRCGPVFAFRDELLMLLSWENPINTFASLIVYCIICLYPKLLFFAPQALLVYFIIVNYPKRKLNTPSFSNVADKKEISKNDKGNASLFSFNFSTLFQPACDESPEYLRNLQNIQNTMGEFCDIYDWIIEQMYYFNWSDEMRTIHVLQLILFLSFLLGFTLYIVPLNYIFLSFGLLVYGINTRFAKYIIRETRPYLIQFGEKNMKVLMDWYAELENKLEQQTLLEEISVFENQRWWPMRGYLHEDERTPWSDFTGAVYMPIITEIPPPKGYEWKDSSEWALDTTGPWIDTYLGIGILFLIDVKPDEDGWIYSDDGWNISTPQIEPVDFGEGDQHKKALTRRRRWVRKCEKIAN